MSLTLRNRVLSIILFLIYPLGIAIFSCYQISKRRDFIFYTVLLSLFVGLYGYLFNARYDLSLDIVRIYNHYEMLRTMSFYEGIPFFILRGDLSLFTLWLLGRTGLNAQIVGFSVASLFCFSLVYLFDKWLSTLKIRNKGNVFILSIILCFMTVHPTFISGVRSPIAYSFFLLGFSLYLSNRKHLARLFFVLSVLNHFMLIFAVFLFFIFTSFKEKKVRIISFVFACCGIFYRSIMNFLLYLLSYCGIIGKLLSEKINYYVFTDLAEGEVRLATGSNIWYIQLFMILGVILLIHILPSAKRKLSDNEYLLKMDTWICLLIGFIFLNITNITMIARFTFFIKVFGILLIISVVGIYKNTFWVKIFQMLFVIVMSTACIALAKEHRAIPEFQVAYQNESKLLYCNIFQILSTDVKYIDTEKQNLVIDE